MALQLEYMVSTLADTTLKLLLVLVVAFNDVVPLASQTWLKSTTTSTTTTWWKHSKSWIYVDTVDL